MKISLSLRDDLVERMRSIAASSRVSDSSVAEVALKRFFATGDEREIAMTLVKEGATARRHTRKTWIDAFYATLREAIPADQRSGFEFMHYDVLADPERADQPNRILVEAREANLPLKGGSYKGQLFPFTTDSSVTEAAKEVVRWLRAQTENRTDG